MINSQVEPSSSVSYLLVTWCDLVGRQDAPKNCIVLGWVEKQSILCEFIDIKFTVVTVQTNDVKRSWLIEERWAVCQNSSHVTSNIIVCYKMSRDYTYYKKLEFCERCLPFSTHSQDSHIFLVRRQKTGRHLIRRRLIGNVNLVLHSYVLHFLSVAVVFSFASPAFSRPAFSSSPTDTSFNKLNVFVSLNVGTRVSCVASPSMWSMTSSDSDQRRVACTVNIDVTLCYEVNSCFIVFIRHWSSADHSCCSIGNGKLRYVIVVICYNVRDNIIN